VVEVDLRRFSSEDTGVKATLFSLVDQVDLALRTWLLAHMAQIATAITGALLVIFGDDINRFVKRRVGHRHFAIRTLAFVLLCGFGYGLMAVFLAPGIIAVLRYFGNQYILLTVVGAFVWIGVMAERKRYM
tara:strand:- start:489 stop:881 length:393 start_codon:yes stop_codon:yes gene_type:complete